MRSHKTAFSLALAGLGLVLLGIASCYLFWERPSSRALQATDFSSIPVRVQSDAPELELSDLDGTHHALSDYRGQVVLVNLWATWCPPCEAEMPNLQRFYEKHAKEGLVVIGIEDGD